MTKLEQYQSVIGRANWVLFLVAVASIPFPQVCSRYALVAWIVAWVLELRWVSITNLKAQIANYKIILPILLFGVWYLWRAISGLWSADHRAWGFMMERYMTYGLLIPVALLGVNDYYGWRKAAKVFVIACAISVIYYIVFFTILTYHPDWIKALGYEKWNYTVSNWWRNFMENCSCIKHRLYWCTTQILAAVLAFEVWDGKEGNTKRNTIIKWILVLVILSALPLTGSRQSVFTLAGVLVIAVISLLPHKHRVLYSIGIVTVGIAIGCSILFTHPRMKVIFSEPLSIEHLTKYESRLGIWSIALSEPKDYVLFGLGGGQSVGYLNQQYDKYKARTYKERNYHAHNQYLEELMELGVFGLIFFIIAWLSVLICSKGKGKQTAVYFVTAFGLIMITDCAWGKFDGIALWAVMMLIILLQSREAQ